MYKSKRQKNKSFDWYGLSQRFSIRKYHFGAASVLLGTALILGAAQSTAKAEEATADNKTEAVTSTPKDGEGATSPTNVTLPATEARTGAPVLDKKELSEEEIAKLAAEASKKDDKTSETATSEKTEVADKEKATLVADSTAKKSEKAVDDKADKQNEKKAENPIAATKTILEQLTSEAEVLNTTAANYAEKKVEDKSSKEAIAAAVAAAKVEITASKKVLNEKDVTAEQLNLQLQRISSAIEAVYTEMKRAGHIGKVEAVLADVTATVKLPERTKVRNTSSLTDEEVDGIIRQVRIANPNLTDADKISVLKNSGQANNAGEVTITYANGDTAKIASGDAIIGAGVARNVEGLKDAINWFEFSAASIVYPDGTEVGPARYLDTPKRIQVDHPNGNGSKVTANLNIVRDVKYTDGTTGLTTDDKFLNSGITEFTVHEYYTGGFQNNNEAYEVIKEGMVFKVPTRVKGYNLTLRVEKLAPKQVATDPNSTETRGKNAMSAANADKFKPVKMILTTQDRTNSYLYKAGMTITDKNNRPALGAITTNRDGANAGITFSASATFNGQPVPVNLVAADGEESGRGEVLQFETNGSNWKELMAINLTEKQQTAQAGYKLGGDVKATTEGELDFYAGYTRNKIGYKASEWVNKTQAVDDQGNLRYDSQGRPIMTETAYGTKFFGPTWNAMRQGNALGLAFSEGVSEFSMYINSAGAQAGSIGFVVYDGGDAPQSFGTAQHVIGNINRVSDQGQQVVATQPHFGEEPGDPDFRSTATDPSGAWVLDDLVNTNGYRIITMQEGNAVTNEAGETGTYKLVDVNGRKTPVLLKSDGSTTALKTGDILKINNPEDNFPIKGIFDVASQGVGVGTLPDEGKGQLLDPAVATDYKLRQATDSEYVLDGIKVNPGENNEKAYARGWVDFNNNGKFDEDESSEVVEVTGKQTVSFKFKNTPQLLNTSIDDLGVRLRIALDKNEILSPTGLASSGEVEDFLTHVIHPPRGKQTKTKNYQGEKQTLEMSTSDLFTATGKTDRSNYQNWNQIDQTIPPKIVVTESVVAKEVPTGDADVNVTDPSGTTVYRGTVVKVYDKRNNELGTAVKVTNPLNGTTEYLLSNYTEYDTAGNKVGVYSLNKENNGLNKADSNGIYKTKIEFTPELAYVGTAKGIAIRAWDENRVSTGWSANDKTIEESKRNITLADKDKILANVNEDVNGRLSMDTTYVPTVVDIKPVGKDEITTDVQGKEQSATPKIPDHGTVESITDSSIDESKISKEHVLIDKTKPITFANEKIIPGKVYTEDTKVIEETVLTYEDGGTETFKPADKIPAGTEIAKSGSLTITGEGNVLVSGVRITETGTTNSPNKVPAGSVLEGAQPTAPEPIKVLRNGIEVTVNTGEKLQVGDKLITPLPIVDGKQITLWKVPLQKGDVIPAAYSTFKPKLAEETSVDKLTGTKGATLTFDGNKYVYNNDTIPQGTKTVGTTVDLSTITLPNATHVDPATGVVTTVPRRYTTISDNKIVIENEGTYTIVPKTSTNEKGQTIYEDAKVVFTPDPKFVGVGTGVTLKQPDLDYNTRVDGDKVTSRYGTDYGYAKYTPVVTPDLTATITRKIHYVYEGDKSTPATAKKPILTIDDKPVVNEQTLTYNRDYIIMEKDGVTEKDIKVANAVTLNAPIKIKRFVKENNQTVEKEITTNTLQPGDEVKAGTQLSAGTVIIGVWKPINDENAKFTPIISPVLKGYTAEVQLPSTEYTKKEENGVQTHVRNANSTPAGIYTPSAPGGNVDTVNVGAYEPLVSVVRADDKDDFDVYVYYKADKQKANVVYIDLDEKGDKRVLETQSGTKVSELPTGTTQDPKTTYGVEKLSGESDSTIPYDTADTIKKYTDKGYELASDDYKNDENGRALADGRNFDEDSSVDQTFYVYLRHKKEQLSTNDKRTVTRHIEYKYADTDDVPADKKGQPVEEALAKTVTEVLTFERTRTLDMATTAKLFENEYNAYKAVLANNAVGSDAEVDARANLFEFVQGEVNKPTATDEVKAIISYGEWQAKPGTGENIELSAAEKTIKDSKFNDVVSPTVPGYLPDNAKVEATADVNPESDPDDYTVTVTYSPGDQKAIVNFVEVDRTNTDQVITPGLADPVTLTGKSGAAFPTTANDSVQAKIAELVKKGYELVDNGNGFVSTDSFDTNSAVDQTYTVKLRAKEAPVVPTDSVTPQPGQPVDPGNPDGPKWPESVKDLKNKDVVKRTIKYVYEDGTPVIDPATGAQKVVEQTAEFTRTSNVNLVTGNITYGDWTPAKELAAVASPTATDIPAVANHIVSTATVPAVTVAAEADDITETVVYRQVKPITVQPNDPTPTKDQPIDPNNPDGPKWTEDLLKKLEDARKEEVNRTITYKYSDVASELKADDAAKAGQNAANEVTNKVEFKRPVTIDPKTLEFTYGDWVATNNDTTLEGNTTVPVVPGYVATGDVEKSKANVTDVKAEDKDITDKVVYKALGKYVPVVPEGFTPPTIQNPQYPNNNDDPSKPGDPTTTTKIPYVPGLTPLNPTTGQPLEPVTPGNPKDGYKVPELPKDPTQNTTITYVKDGSQVAVTHFIEVNSATDKTEKGAVATSIVDTGDTGKAFTKGQSVTDTINALKAKGYTVVENGYPANGTFDADVTTNQEYKVLVTVKPVTITPNTDVPNEDPNTPVDPNNPIQPGKPIAPTNPEGPKWTKDLIDKLRDARKEEVTRTITYKYSTEASELKADDAAKAGQEAADTVTNTVTFKRSVTIDPVTKEFTYGDWEATNGTTLAGKAALPVVSGYVATGDVESSKKNVEKVKATDKDITENVVYKTVGKYVPVIPEGIIPPANTNVDPKPYTNDPQDGSKVKDPDPTNPVVPGTTTPIVPQIPGTTPVGPDGKPLKPVDPADPSKGYVPPTPTDPTKDTSIIYVKDGSQVAVVHFVDDKGNSVNESVIETGDTGGTISTTKADAVKTALEAKGYEVVAPTDALYTADKEGFYKEADRKFDAVSDKATGAANEKVPSQQYYVIVKAKELPVVPTKPVNPNNDPVDPTDPTTPNKPRDPETTVTPKPTDKVPNDPKNRTYGELGLVETVTRTINYVKNDGSKAADPVKEILTFTRKAKINAVTGEVTYLDNDGNASTKEAGPWTPVNGDKFAEKTSPSVTNYTPTVEKVAEKTGVTATDPDIVETVVYNPSTTTIDPNPTTPGGNVEPNSPVPGDPKGRTYKDLGLVEEVTHTVHYKLEDGSDAGIADNVQKVTFTRTAKIDSVTGAILEYGKWTPEMKEFTAVTTPTQDGYIASAKTSTANANVGATDKDTEETIIYRKLGSYVPVVPAGVTPPADFDKTPKPYPNATPEDPTKPGTPTTTTTIPEIPGTTPVGPDGTPLTKNPNGGYDVPPVPTDPTQNTTITYVKDGSQVAVTHFIEVNSATDKTEKGAVATSIVDTGDTGKAFTKGQSVTDTINALKAKGYTVVENGYPENGTFDSDVTTNQEYKVLVTVKEIPVTPDDVTPTPDTPIDPNNPNGPKWTPELIKELEEGRTEDVKRTIKYIYSDGTAVEDSNLTSVADKKEKTLTFKRSATINPVTGKITFGNWTPAKQSFEEVTSPEIDGYIVDRATVPAKEVTETAGDITEVVVYKKLGSYVPVVPEGVTVPPGTDTTPKVYPKDPTDPTRPGTPTTVIPHIPGVTPLNPSTGKPLEPVTPGRPEDGYKVPPVPTDPTQDTNIVYAKDGSQVAIVHFVDEDGNAVHTSFVEAGNAGSKFTKAGEVAKIVTELEKSGYSVVSNKADQKEYPGKEGEFDSVDDKGENGVSQVYYVTVAKPVPVTPTDPKNPNEDPKNPNPGDPIDPNKPDGPKWTEDALNKLNNIKTVTRTITYVKAGTDEEVSSTEAPKVTDKVNFKRTAIVNPKDGSLVGYDTNGDGKADVPATDTDSGWTAVNNDTTFDKVTSPVVKGYVLKNTAQKEVAETTGLTPKSDNETIKVEYVPVGTWTPKVPEGETPINPIPYPNDPKDPGKVVDPNDPINPNDPNKPSVPVIPHIPGTTPKDPNGNPLKPVDPTDPSKGYVPPTPKTPTENTEIKYEKDTQKATVKYVIEGANTVLHTDNLEGKSGEAINYSTADKLADLKVLGYELVTDGFTTATDKNFDKDTKVDQNFVVTVKPKVVDVPPFDPTNPNDPNIPKPGQPIDPENPNGPKWTEELIKSLDTTKHVNRTISYVKEDGSKVEYLDKDGNKSTADVTDKVTFTRDLKVNVVTGKIVDPNVAWTSKDTTFDAVKSPVAPGYVLKDATQKVVAETTGLTENSKDETIKVVYVPVGTWVPNVPKGETPIDPIPYPNDPKDPGKVVDPNDPTNPNDPNKPSVPVIPHIPGTTPKDPNGNPLKPVDPEDPTKGYVPPTPTTPTENTEINYEKDTQKAVTKFVDPSGNPIPGVTNIEETGKSGEPLTKATEVTTEIAKLIAKGYDLVSNNYGKDNNGNFDKDSGKDQEYTVVLIPHVEPIKPFDPTNPDDPNTPKPGQPIDPNNPDGPKWTEELINKLETTKHVTRKITYVEDGTDKEVADKATDKVTFTREAKINVVTGTIEYGKWTPVNNDTTFDKVTSPVVPGYVLKDPAQKEVAETTGLTENSKDETIKVVYVPVGRLVPKVPEGVTPPTPTPYDNDPQDPGKVVPPSPTKPTDPQDPNSPKVPVIPHIPGTTPKVPQDPTKPVDPNTNPLVPLKPVDPKDPSKGYEVPPVPTDPGTDTPIVYENDKQKAITNFVDNNGKVVSDPVVDQGDSGSKFTKSGDVESKIKELVKKGYVVTSNDYPSADTDRVFDNDKDKDQIFNVKVTPLIVPTDPNSPDQPQVPTDPTKPVGPNNPLKPVTPSTPEPGKPVFPEDPNSPVWPETVKDMVTETTATRTITYVDRNGKEVAATHTETIKFKRTAKVNLVTGDITYGEWIVVGNDTILDGNKLPKVDGYIARGGDIESSQKDIKATAGVNITERVVYDKLGSWIPKLPEGQTQVPPTPYPNDPTDPTKPGTDRPRVPYVPGFIPVDPNGNPLKPVDPNDPTKGYEVPVVPADPTQDTPIKYIPVPKPNNGGGNNGGGGGNTPTPQPQPNPTPQPEPSPAPNPVPVTPETPEQPVVPVAPEQPAEPATPQYMDGQRELPNTGTEAHSSLAALGLLGALSGFGLIARKKRKDEE